MKTLSSVRDGHYAKKQLLSRDWLISWSHRRRFETALTFASRLTGDRILDFGCGDGTFLATLMQSSKPPLSAVGCDISHTLLEDCRHRLGHFHGLTFVLNDELFVSEHINSYDVVFCMEVLEHVLDAQHVLRSIKRLLAPNGRVVISVPVETGPPLAIKQAIRRLAGWRGLNDYPGICPYTIREYVASLCAGPSQHIARPVHYMPDRTPFHDHKGFNWQVIRRYINEVFDVEYICGSPIRWLPPHLGSQVWFVAANKRS